MPTVILTQAEVRRLLPMETCIDLVADALGALARGDAANPLRWMFRLPERPDLLGMMPGYTGTPDALGLKVVAVFPGNHGTDYDSHQGLVVLFDTEHGFPLAIMDASEITAIRTAAATGLATRLLAREDAGDLALLGSGVQARTHLEAMNIVRELRRVRVYSPHADNRESFASAASERYDFDVQPVGSAREAVEGADIICTVTSSREPVLFGDWISPGAHVNAVGSSTPSARELDASAVARSRLFVDRRESTLNESGDFLFAKQEGAVDDDHIQAEIGEILLGVRDGRRTDDEVTLFKSLGLAVEDVAAAHHVLERARSESVGTLVELGGTR